MLAVLTALSLSGCKRQDDVSFDRLMNLGKAYLENRDSKNALDVLTKAVLLQPQSAPALRNLARAQRLARTYPEAVATLDRAAKIEPQSPATSYLLALALASQTRFADAIPHFEAAVRVDANEATLRFQLAGAYEAAGQRDKAVEQLHETVRLDPLHASAHFKLAGFARQAGNREEMELRQREFVRLRKLFGDETRSGEALELCVYTQPEPVPSTKAAAPDAAPPVPVRFMDATEATFASEPDAIATAACVIDVDETGRSNFFVVGPGGARLMNMSASGVFTFTALDAALPGDARYDDCIVGNFRDDVPTGEKYDPKVHAANDVVLLGSSGVRLLERTGSTSFRDGTDKAGLSGITARSAAWVDYEHDGDLDLLLARESGAELWQNNGDGTFQNVTATVGITSDGAAQGAADVVAIDLDENVAVDLIVAHGSGPTRVYLNQRAGRFAAMPEPPGPWPAADRMLVNDLNNDGAADAILLRRMEADVLYGRTTKRGHITFPGVDPTAATLADFDNDGRLDLLVPSLSAAASGEGTRMLALRNAPDGSWVDVSVETGLAAIPLPGARRAIPLDIDLDGDSDLLLTGGDRLRVLRNEGGNANGQLKLRLTTVKTNTTGLGTRIELRDAAWKVTRFVTGLPIEIGVGRHVRFDSLLTVWTNGVVDNEIDVKPSRAPLTLVEKNVATGSCPFLYAWDGQAFRFVTDLLGNAPIGLPLSRDVMLPADPDEIVRIGDAATFKPRDGAYTVVITDEFREVLYLDEARLMAVDHAPGVEVQPTDKLMPPPFPTSEVWALANPREAVSAVGDDGLDRTDAVRGIDEVFAPPGVALPAPYRGMTHPLSITLDFGALDIEQPLVLALTGWLQYGDGSTNIAMSQNSSLTIIPPTLEAETADGAWRPIDLTVGMPAGKTKTILCDLADKLPAGARRLRLTTTFEIRWDRIALFERVGLDSHHVHIVGPSSADLQWRGFSEIKQRVLEGPTTPDFGVVSQRPPWRTTLSGWCTRYGDALELVTHRDDKIALVNAGDALTVRFDAAAFPPVPAGMIRTFFLYSVGWDKDGDHNVVASDTVEPLPVGSPPYVPSVSPPSAMPSSIDASPDESDWQVFYNTRFVPRDRFAPDR